VTSSLHPQLSDIDRQLADLTARARRLVDATDERTFGRRPRAASWSVGECLAHLALTTHAYLPLMDEALAAPPPRQVSNERRYRRDLLGWLLCVMLEPPYRLKTRTAKPFEPVAVSATRAEVWQRFVEAQRELSSRVNAAAQHDLGRIRIASPFDRRARYNLYSAFCAILAHERRHLWQAERALDAVAG
jgi:hypothetical protein